MFIYNLTTFLFLDFQAWKESREKKMQCVYVKISGSKGSGTKQKTYYVCHRSFKSDRYTSTSQNDRQKLLKSQGFMKMSVTCPSSLELISDENKFKATLFTPHIGHKGGLKHLNLNKNERKQIAGMLNFCFIWVLCFLNSFYFKEKLLKVYHLKGFWMISVMEFILKNH